MSALDGKITIEIGLRPCIVENSVKALFHLWAVKRTPHYEIKSPVKGFLNPSFEGFDEYIVAIVEYEDGTIHEVEPTQIRFVDNAMSEYVFPEENESRGKSEDKWKPLKRAGYICPKCGQGTMKLDEGIVLTSNPPQYRYQCDKCGYVECSSGQIEVSDIDEYEPG